MNMVSTCPSKSNKVSAVFKEPLFAFSLRFYTFDSMLNLQHNINILITKFYHFLHHARRKTTTIYKLGVKKTITKEYKVRFF